MMTNVVGWEGDVERWKKVGISSLSKKLMIQAGAGGIYALVGIHLFFHVLELSIQFSQFLGLNFVRGEHQNKIKKKRS